MDVINIDINLLKRYTYNKQRKELFALAIWCHIKHTSASIRNFDRFFLRKNLHIGKAKAEKLIEEAMNDQLFTFNGSSVSVGSFRNKNIKYNRKGREYRSAFVYKFYFDRNYEYTLKDLYNLINEIITLFPIAAKENKDCLQQRGGLNNRCGQFYCDAFTRTLTLKKLSSNNNMSLSSTSRLMKKLVNTGKISKEPARIYTSLGCEHNKEIADQLNRLGRHSSSFEHGGLTYFVVPCAYSIADRKVSNSFTHLIYNYHKSTVKQPEYESTIPQLCGF